MRARRNKIRGNIGSSVEGYLSLMRPGPFTLLYQANNPFKLEELIKQYEQKVSKELRELVAFEGYLSLMRPCHSSIISLDLQSLSQS